jgi:HAD superfamily hydrolase (TIGR01509 family)
LTASLQAVIFDFDGVIANSEPLHLRAFQLTLAGIGITLTAEEYFSRYLGFDDVGVFQELGRDRGLGFSGAAIERLVAEKGLQLQALTQGDGVLFPGAKEFIRLAAATVPVAIASGALRHEIEEVLEAAGLRPLFRVIVASGDTPQSKPSPDPYDLAFRRLQEVTGAPLARRRCVAIEDSRWGLESARGAGLRCVAVTNSYPAHELGVAELVAGGLNELTLEALDRLVANPA